MRESACFLLFLIVQAPERHDLYGDPIPPGAVCRMGGAFRAHGHQVESLAFSPDGRMIATAAFDQAVRLWDAASGREVRVLQGHPKPVYCVAFSRDGATIASGGQEGAESPIRLWETATGKPLRQLAG